jgi:hypothetical protein
MRYAQFLLPVIYQEELFPGQGNHSGLGDMTPRHPRADPNGACG